MLRQTAARNEERSGAAAQGGGAIEAPCELLGDAGAVCASSPASIEPWFSLRGTAAAPKAEAEQLDLLLAGVELAARRGCERVWLEGVEGFALAADSLRLALWVAGQIESVRVVATGVRVAPVPSTDTARSWIRLAEDAATADGICGGRLELAFEDTCEGRGGLARTVALLREVWSGGRVSPADGAERIEVHPRPCRPDGPKLWARVRSSEAADEAAEAELGAIVSIPGLAREGQESAFLTAEPGAPEAAAQKLIALRHSVPIGEEAGVASAWLGKLESRLMSST